jgi:putative ABC transport system ATP-binding protein
VNSEKIIALTKKVVKEKKITTLMITHNISHAIEVGEGLLLLSKGKIKLDVKGEEKKKLTIEKLVKELHHEHLELEEDI